MIVDDNIWNYVSDIYGVENDIVRYGIIVNEETEECIVEIYLKSILIFPIPNLSLFKFQTPKYIILSRKETIEDLTKKI